MNDKKRRTADTTGNQQAETSDWNTVEKPADVSACHTMTKRHVIPTADRHNRNN